MFKADPCTLSLKTAEAQALSGGQTITISQEGGTGRLALIAQSGFQGASLVL